MKKIIIFGLVILTLSLFLIGCTDRETKAVQTAQGFAVTWQNEDWDSLYDYFTSDLKSMRNKQDFVAFIKATDPTKLKLIYDKAVLQNKKEAYAYYTFTGSYLFQPKTPAVHMVYEKWSWKIDAFASYFIDSCSQSSCTDFDTCTKDICDNTTGFTCKHKQIKDCCKSNYDCPVDKPYCRSNSCSNKMCLTHTDCPNNQPACKNNVCTGCTANYHCRDELYPFCSESQCLQCLTDNDCVTYGFHKTDLYGGKIYLKKCNTFGSFKNYCVECTSNSDCSGKKICTSYDTCKEVECVTDKHCPSERPYCWKKYNSCSSYDFD